MFICHGCTHPEDREQFMYMPRSKGPCEVCRYVDICIDARPRINPKWREQLAEDLMALEESKK